MNEATKFFWENRPPLATQALHDVMAERHRQMMVEGWTAKHDDEHGNGAMAVAAACYALASEPVIQLATVDFTELWKWTGWAKRWWKPKDKRRNLVRATALLLAEIERMDRAAARGVPVVDECGTCRKALPTGCNTEFQGEPNCALTHGVGASHHPVVGDQTPMPSDKTPGG